MTIRSCCPVCGATLQVHRFVETHLDGSTTDICRILCTADITHPMTDDSRLLTCTRCHDNVRVTEIPRQFIDPALYVCGDCAQPKPVTQLALEARIETRHYDPAIAQIPY